MSRLCRCGAIVDKKCSRCDKPRKETKSTSERGYGYDWYKFSLRYRSEYPICQVCESAGRIEPATEVHHIEKITDRPDLRLDWSNCLSVCQSCHKEIENNPEKARKIKKGAWH
jgi:5-methylcytosine-specific restriction protein A